MAKETSSLVQHQSLAHCLRSERFIVTVKVGAIQYKVFQIIFPKSDGTLCVNFPYFKLNEGILSHATLAPGIVFPADLSLNDGGKVTTKLVKYSHHPDGRAHFSQDGRVFTAIKKQAQPINKVQGHEFTVQLQGLKYFEPWAFTNSNMLHTTKCTTLCFSFNDKEPDAIRFSAHWYSQEVIKNRVASGVIGPSMVAIDPEGKHFRSFLCSTPAGRAGEDRILVLSGADIPRLSQDDEGALTFVGGFDGPEIISDRTRPTTLLALSYPFPNTDVMTKILGSVDLEMKAG